MRRGTKCLTPPCRRFSTTISTTSELNICTFIFWWWNGLTIFPFLRWTIVPTARLPPALIALSGCLLSIDSQLLPVKFNCPFSPLQILSNCSQEPWLSYTHILRNCCRLALFASAPWNSWPCVEGRGVGIFTGSCGKNWSSCCVCIVQQADKLMILNQDFFFLGGEGTFWVFFGRMGSVSCSLIPDDCFWSKEGWWHWHIPPGTAPWVSEGFRELRWRNLALLISRAGTVKDSQTPSLPQASCQPWAAAAAAPYWGCPLPSCDDVCWLGQAICKRL